MGLMSDTKYPLHCKVRVSDITATATLRCDAKQFEGRFDPIKELRSKNDYFFLGELLPAPLVKGGQPSYIEDGTGVPVINTLSIQKMRIHAEDCRFISEDDFDRLPSSKKLKKNDVLLTMDGGTSIGKSAVFHLEGNYTVDSHVAILRPAGISSKALVYLLASPFGQLQFNKAESGASGQTAVTEEELRRFIFPKPLLENIEELSAQLDKKRRQIEKRREKLDREESAAWKSFVQSYLGKN